jgi:hypothetical protein
MSEFFESFDNTLGFRYERMAVVVQGLAKWGDIVSCPHHRLKTDAPKHGRNVMPEETIGALMTFCASPGVWKQ